MNREYDELKKRSNILRKISQTSLGRQIIDPALFREQAFEDYLPYTILLDDDKTIQTQDRRLIQCIRLTGLNATTAPPEKLNSLKKLFAEIIANSEDNFSYYVHKLSKPVEHTPSPITNNRFSKEVDKQWLKHLAMTAARETTVTISLIIKPQFLIKNSTLREKCQFWKKEDQKFESYKYDRQKQLIHLNELTGIFLTAFTDISPNILTASSGALLGFLEAIGCGTETRTFLYEECAILSRSIANYRPTIKRNVIEISCGSPSTRIGRVFTVRNYPRSAFSGMFDAFRFPLDTIVTHSFTPISHARAKEILRRTLAQRSSINDVAYTDQQQIHNGQNRVASGLETLGHHHMTVAIYTDSLDILEEASAEVYSIAQKAGIKLIAESLANRGHYFSQWPGNEKFRLRTALVSNYAFSCMASLHRIPTGLHGNEVPWKAPITAFPTSGGGFYRFHFHPKSESQREPPAAHTAIFGGTGAGKTVLINFLITQSRCHNIRMFLFDYRKGMETTVKALEGQYITLSPEQPTGLNPLYSETDASGRAWLTDWLIALLDRDDKRLTPIQRNAISQAVLANSKANKTSQNFKNFPECFAHLDDEGDLSQRIEEWNRNGRYGWVFSENNIETFTMNNPVMGFDITTLIDSCHEKEKTAILGYLFQQIEKKLRNKYPSLIIIDEAWVALSNEYFSKKLINWLVTARKLNTVVILVTQFPSQLIKSQSSTDIFQALRTYIILPNRNANPDHYTDLHLNNRELEGILNSPVGTWPALIKNETESVVINTDFSCLGHYLDILGGGIAGEKAYNKYKTEYSHVSGSL